MSFADDMKKYADKVGNDLEEQTVATLMQLNSSVITRTPVDTGRARGGWIASIGSTASGESGGSVSKANGVAKNAVGKVYYLTNNLKYIRKLEYGGYSGAPSAKLTADGYSRQAPSGMVRISIKEIKQAIQGIFA